MVGSINDLVNVIIIKFILRAYNRVKEKLPNKKNIKSKKEIIDQVGSFNYNNCININNCVLQLQAIDYIRELNDTLSSSSGTNDPVTSSTSMLL